MTTIIMLDPIESAISGAYTDWVEDYEVTHSSRNLVRGTFLGQEGIVYDFRIRPQGVEFQESRQDTADFNDYFLAQLHSAGSDYHGDSAYTYWQGFVNADVRTDRGVAKCKTGVPCNGRCLPKGHKCRSQGGSLKQGGEPDPRDRGNTQRSTAVGAVVGGLIAGPIGSGIGGGIGYARAKGKQGKSNNGKAIGIGLGIGGAHLAARLALGVPAVVAAHKAGVAEREELFNTRANETSRHGEQVEYDMKKRHPEYKDFLGKDWEKTVRKNK